jgi:hypothetical protein
VQPNPRVDEASAMGWGDMSAFEMVNVQNSGVAGERALARHARGR